MTTTTLNPRTEGIARLVSEKLDSGMDYFTAVSLVSDETLLSVSVIDDCYVSCELGTTPNVPSGEWESDEEDGYWNDTDVLPSFPWESGYVSVYSLVWIVAFALAVAYALTL